MSAALAARIAAAVDPPIPAEVRAFAERLALEQGAIAALFYGSNLRSGSLDGVLDFYVLLPGRAEPGLWPRVSYHELADGARMLRAKAATVTLAMFAQAAQGQSLDTTIWARFVQPSALVWTRDAAVRDAVIAALGSATVTAARLAATLGPARGTEPAYWSALFRATYRAEFRIERPGREQAILETAAAHFAGLLPLALEAAGIGFSRADGILVPELPPAQRALTKRWWRRRRLAGRPLNLLRLLRASATFDGAARYAAWKIERHTGVAVRLTPWRERHPLLAAPAVLWTLWCHRRSGSTPHG